MYHWVANHLTIHGDNAVEVMRSLLEKNKYVDYDFDFNKIIPKPQDLPERNDSTTCASVEVYLTSINPFINDENKVEANEYLKIYRAVNRAKSYGQFNDELPPEEIRYREIRCLPFTREEILANGKKAVENAVKYGAMDVYDWCAKYWESPTNASQTNLHGPDVAEVNFDTECCPVFNIIRELSKQHPECVFEYEYADDDAGFSAGHYVYEAGEVILNEGYPSYSPECYELYFELWGHEDEFQFNEQTGTYEEIEEEEEM